MKSWMNRRPGETEDERLTRITHSCYRCGHYESDLAALGRHEDACDAHVACDYRLRVGRETEVKPPRPG